MEYLPSLSLQISKSESIKINVLGIVQNVLYYGEATLQRKNSQYSRSLIHPRMYENTPYSVECQLLAILCPIFYNSCQQRFLAMDLVPDDELQPPEVTRVCSNSLAYSVFERQATDCIGPKTNYCLRIPVIACPLILCTSIIVHHSKLLQRSFPTVTHTLPCYMYLQHTIEIGDGITIQKRYYYCTQC